MGPGWADSFVSSFAGSWTRFFSRLWFLFSTRQAIKADTISIRLHRLSFCFSFGTVRFHHCFSTFPTPLSHTLTMRKALVAAASSSPRKSSSIVVRRLSPLILVVVVLLGNGGVTHAAPRLLNETSSYGVSLPYLGGGGQASCSANVGCQNLVGDCTYLLWSSALLSLYRHRCLSTNTIYQSFDSPPSLDCLYYAPHTHARTNTTPGCPTSMTGSFLDCCPQTDTPASCSAHAGCAGLVGDWSRLVLLLSRHCYASRS
jgi:hypothetical protein